MKTGNNFSVVLSGYKALRAKYGVRDPSVEESIDLLLDMYGRPGANVLLLVDELSKTASLESIREAAFSLSSLRTRRNVFEIVTALQPLDKAAVAFGTDTSNRNVLNVYLSQLAAQTLVAECDRALDLNLVNTDVVRSVLSFAAGNARLVRVVFNTLKDKTAGGRFKHQLSYKHSTSRSCRRRFQTDRQVRCLSRRRPRQWLASSSPHRNDRSSFLQPWLTGTRSLTASHEAN